MPLSRRQKRRLFSLPIGLVIGLVFGLLGVLGVFESYELQSLDFRFKLRGERPLSKSICMVVVDNQTLKTMGWPVRFLQWADHDEVLRLLARTELLLFPSRWQEPLSRVLLEASACGAPILAMATGGTPEIVQDGVNGALVPPRLEPFAERLLRLLWDPAERRRLGMGARRVATQRYAAPVVARQVEQLYQSLLGGGQVHTS